MTDALSDVNAIIERVRLEADAAGYARAWMEIQALSAKKIDEVGEEHRPKPRQLSVFDDLPVERQPRGRNRELVERVLSDASGPKTAQQIKTHLEKRRLFIAYSSVQQALSQLLARGLVVKDDLGMWSFRKPVDEDEEL